MTQIKVECSCGWGLWDADIAKVVREFMSHVMNYHTWFDGQGNKMRFDNDFVYRVKEKEGASRPRRYANTFP